jgi:hypothetical protein
LSLSSLSVVCADDTLDLADIVSESAQYYTINYSLSPLMNLELERTSADDESELMLYFDNGFASMILIKSLLFTVQHLSNTY